MCDSAEHQKTPSQSPGIVINDSMVYSIMLLLIKSIKKKTADSSTIEALIQRALQSEFQSMSATDKAQNPLLKLAVVKN